MNAPAPKPTSHLSDTHAVRLDDSALLVLSDSSHDPLWAISEDSGLDVALHKMARLDRGALLVMSEHYVVGLITREDIKRKGGGFAEDERVLDVMTDAVHIPIIDWQTVLHATVSDLLTLFESTRSNHLAVLQAEGLAFARVRGLIYRRQLLRRLGVFPVLDRGMELALGHAAKAPIARHQQLG
jgi:CBS domain-containing protein